MDNCRDDECLVLLQKALDDENVDPINLTYSVFKIITDKFSPRQLIGQGGFGAVYKGKLKNGTVVAVKKLHNKIENLENPSKKIEILERNFQSEIDCLKNAKHENIVRFLGYCAEAEPVVTYYPNEGREVRAEEWHRLFCLEYVSKGNLSEHISEPSSGLKWRKRYQIIKGICEGVDYLHWQNIVHMDLKPQNILLGDGMVPKIADFGLSKRFTEDQSKTFTANRVGTLGYMAPEFIDSGTITMKADIYSLGVIIIEILTGCRRDWLSIDMVLESWSSIFEKWRNRRSLLVLEEQVKLCATIGMACIDKNSSNRPAIQFIISCLNKMDISNSSSTSSVPSTSCREVCKQVQLELFSHHYEQARQACKSMRICGSKLSHSGLSESESLDVYPLELRFPFFQRERKRTRQCSLNFANWTDRYVGYWIFPEFPMYTRCDDDPAILDPFSTAIVCVEMEMQEQPPPPQHTDMILVVMIRKENKMDLQGLISFLSNEATTSTGSLLRRAEELGGEVHAAMLKAVAVYPAGDGDGVTCQLSSSSLRGRGGGDGPPAGSGAPMMGGMAMPPPPPPQQQQPVQGMMMRPPNVMGGGGWQQQQYTAAQGQQQQQYMAAQTQQQQYMARMQQQQMNGHGGYPAVGYGYSRPAMQYPQLPSPYGPPAYYYNSHPRDNIFSDENPNSCTVM